VCLVAASVGADGVVIDTQLLKSAGSSDLDAACIDAVVLTDFSPAKKDGVAVRSAALLAIFLGVEVARAAVDLSSPVNS
jgi:TonB family protein